MSKLSFTWDALLITAVFLMLFVPAKVRADYYLVTVNADQSQVDYKRFISVIDCTKEELRTGDIIAMTGGQGSVLCVHEDQLKALGL